MNPNLVLIILIGSLLFISWCGFSPIPSVFSSASPEFFRACGATVKPAFSVNWESFLALRKANGLYDLNRVGSGLANSQSNFNCLLVPVDFLVLLQSEQVGEVNLKMEILFPF